ncbi:MAG TPA: hypothetical protein VNA25_13510 [Phycisphaerae bacterium]|nr:hypothetical protein [Phycisphaerae bacterium]
MAVINIKKGFTGVEAGGDDRSGTTTECFTVLTDPGDSQLFSWPISDGVLTIPAPGTSHLTKDWYLSQIPHVAKKGPGYFEVRVPYKTPDPFDEKRPGEYEDPLSMPAEISWGDERHVVAYDKDLQDPPKPVVNAMGQPFDPRLTREICDPVLTIDRNQAAFDPDDKLAYQDTTNLDEFWGAPLGVARLTRMQARSVDAVTPYYRAHFEIVFRVNVPPGTPEGKAWWRCILNQGTIYKDDAGVTQKTADGQLCLLAADGKQTTPEAPHWLYFREYKDKSWFDLGLED